MDRATWSRTTWLFASAVVACHASAQPSVHSRSELLTIAQEMTIYFDSTHVCYSLQIEKQGPLVPSGSLVERTECELWRSGQRIRRDLVNSGESPTGAQTSVSFVQSFDGARSHTRNDDAHSYIVKPSVSPEEQATIGDAFMDFHLRNKVVANSGGLRGQSIIALLSTSTATVRPEQESVNGVLCHVVDIPIASTSELQGTVWVDPTVGCLPMQQVFYGLKDEAGEQPIVLKYEVLKTHAVDVGIEIVQEGLRTVLPATGREVVFRYILEIAEGDPTFGTPIDEKVFSPHIPSGYMCKDVGENKSWLQP